MQTVFRGVGEGNSHELLKFCGQKEKWENVPIGIEVVAGYAIKLFSFNSAALFPCQSIACRVKGQLSYREINCYFLFNFMTIMQKHTHTRTHAHMHC